MNTKPSLLSTSFAREVSWLARRPFLVSGSVIRPIVEHTHLGEIAPAADSVEATNLVLDSDAADIGVDASECSQSSLP